MPLTPAEALTLSPKAVALGQAIGEALTADSDGGKKITKAEAVRILKQAANLVAALVVDLLD